MDGDQYTVPVTGRLLTVRDVAYATSLSEHTIRKHLMEGRIRFVKVGRSTRISEHELRRLIAEGFRLSKS